jgi:tetratricopeptide (TPR) repeat protein
MVRELSAPRRLLASVSRPLVVVILLLLVVAMGLNGSLWPHVSPWFSRWWPAGARAPTPPVMPSKDDGEEGTLPLLTSPIEGDERMGAPPLPENTAKTPLTARQSGTSLVELTFVDREGGLLRQARGLLTNQERRVVTTFDSVHGAYGGSARLPDNTTASITLVERADAATNLAILSIEPVPASAIASLPTLEALARLTYEDTAAEQRYLAEKRAKAQRWEEALAHWKRAVELDSSIRRESEAALAEAFLNASAAARQQERRADAHNRLLEAADWLPEHSGIRQRLAESFAQQGDYREAIEQYWLALDFAPAPAPDITKAIMQLYRDWGQELLRHGDFPAAASLFRESLQIDATNGGLYFALGQAEFRRQAFEAAVQAFEAAVAYEPGLRGEVEPYLTKARALLGGPETAVITFTPGSTRIEVVVMVNGRLQLPCIIDTGANMTLIPAWAAEALGYRTQMASEWIRVQTAGGLRHLPYASLNRIEIQGLGLSNLPVLFGDLPGHDANRGLLGMDFLRHFSMAIDHDLGRMTLRLR